jgi:histidyl-tRNA synthetase
LLPRERFAEQHVLDVVRRTFELHGYAGIETRAVEPVERLVGKGGDADKEIYAVSRLAGGEDARDASLGLH